MRYNLKVRKLINSIEKNVLIEQKNPLIDVGKDTFIDVLNIRFPSSQIIA